MHLRSSCVMASERPGGLSHTPTELAGCDGMDCADEGRHCHPVEREGEQPALLGTAVPLSSQPLHCRAHSYPNISAHRRLTGTGSIPARSQVPGLSLLHLLGHPLDLLVQRYQREDEVRGPTWSRELEK